MKPAATPGPSPRAQVDLRRPSEWLERHGDALSRFDRSRVARREAAEDLVQEPLLAALRAADGFRGEAQERTWLMGILRRKVADRYRRERTSATTVEADHAESGRRPTSHPFDPGGDWRDAPSRWRAPDDAESWRVLEDCSAKLPSHLARAFLLREIEGVDADQIRVGLCVGAGNLRIRLHRARLLLRECLGKHWFGTGAGRSRRP